MTFFSSSSRANGPTDGFSATIKLIDCRRASMSGWSILVSIVSGPPHWRRGRRYERCVALDPAGPVLAQPDWVRVQWHAGFAGSRTPPKEREADERGRCAIPEPPPLARQPAGRGGDR